MEIEGGERREIDGVKVGEVRKRGVRRKFVKEWERSKRGVPGNRLMLAAVGMVIVGVVGVQQGDCGGEGA